jgi:hypothetical protein
MTNLQFTAFLVVALVAFVLGFVLGYGRRR